MSAAVLLPTIFGVPITGLTRKREKRKEARRKRVKRERLARKIAKRKGGR